MSAFTSNRNIVGMTLALGGVGLFLGGVIGTGWPFIVGGLYVLGVLVAPGKRPGLAAGPVPDPGVVAPPGPLRAQPTPTPPSPSPFVGGPTPLSSPPQPGPGTGPGHHTPAQPSLRPQPQPGPAPDRATPLPATVGAGSGTAPGTVDLGIDGLVDYIPIGSGGFSRVFVATDVDFNRKVAVKVLHESDESVRRWFERERSIMGELSDHPNVITPFRSGLTAAGAPYLVMEYVPGGSLDDLIVRKGLVAWGEAVDHILPICDALTYAHEHGVLHKDIKPANILVGRHSTKLTDFGIASLRGATASETAFTLAHCPPEAFAGGHDRREERSDLYSLASTLHNLIAGEAPFDRPGSNTQAAYLTRIADDPAPALPSTLAPGWLRDLVLGSLAKEVDSRPATVADFADTIRRCAA